MNTSFALSCIAFVMDWSARRAAGGVPLDQSQKHYLGFTLWRLMALALLGLGLSAGTGEAAVRCLPVTADAVRRVTAAASDLNPPPGACGALALTGEIRGGDHAAVVALLERSGPFVERIDTVARGGDAAEAMRIGRLARARHLTTQAPQYRPGRGGVFPARCKPDTECVCAGACVLVWAAGVERLGEHLVFRRVEEPEAAAYLAEMEVPAAYAVTLATLRPGAAQPLSQERLEADLKGLAPSERRRVAGTCGEYSETEAIEWLALTARTRAGSRPPLQDAQALALLDDKIAAVDRCRAAALTAERVRIFSSGRE